MVQKKFSRTLKYGSHSMEAVGPTIEVLPAGKRSYIWIGNKSRNDKRCYGTLSGEITLRKLAYAILAEVGE